MVRRFFLLRIAALFCAVLTYAPQTAVGQSDVLGLYLTWQRDPTTTITIDYHLPVAEPARPLQHRRRGESTWTSRTTSSHPFPYSDRSIHRVELSNLAPGTDYEFRIGSGGRTYRFRTMPREATRPIRFAVGGDVMHRREWMDAMNRVAASQDPDFVVFGGDLAYADSDPRLVGRWYDWFESVMTTLITREGRLIPIIPALGNHEVWFDSGTDAERTLFGEQHGLQHGQAAFFFDLFAFPKRPGYDVLDFGDYLSLVILDTEHVNAIVGAQTAWLDETLAARQDVRHVFPVYHRPAYPSVRSPDSGGPRRIRANWSPLFERYGVRVAFENHDHTYKRTHPMRDGRIDPSGVVYIGDGAWGVEVREIGSGQETPVTYLARADSIRHMILTTLNGDEATFLAYDSKGNVFDAYPENALTAERRHEPTPLTVYPNPASATIVIEFSTHEVVSGTVDLYDALGRRVARPLETSILPSGRHRLAYDVADLPAGAYIIRVEAGGTPMIATIVVR